jgi:hypothetical protein
MDPTKVSLYLVAEQKPNLLRVLLTLIREVLFRLAFAVCMVIQIVLWPLLLAGISTFFASDNYSAQGVLVILAFAGLLPIGAANYFMFEWIVREKSIRAEAEKWLEERRRRNSNAIKRRRIISGIALWIPTVTVVLACLFFDGMWASGSHLLHPRPGRLIGYEVSIPLNWTIRYTDLDANGGGARSIVVAERYRGLLSAGSGLYTGRRPPFSVSTMNFSSTPIADPLATRPADPIVSERTLPFGNGTIVCREEVPPRWMKSPRDINCFTSTGDFSGRFSGSDEDASEFYRTLQSVKITK